MRTTSIAQRLRVVLLSACALLAGCETVTDLGQSATDTVSSAVSSSTPESSKRAFVNDRFKAIRAEAAKGQGENVEALAAMLGERDRQEFARWMQANYAPLFTDLKTPDELLARIENRRGDRG
jgi:predicted small secreted protein